ncbi:hypothetical protein Pan181_45630 [Aeoliella mucimassa]|uniref:Uncharacterized protein n=1 Tax=Aeoliella mucimassa TaxID=2527972 RepID=A0A518AUD0_9BACT|nr:hypothetical protein Pan181_45630 [Aeoliella mucimassa]
MTETQADTIIELLETIQFFAEVCAMVLSFISGFVSWRLIVYAKNHKDIW